MRDQELNLLVSLVPITKVSIEAEDKGGDYITLEGLQEDDSRKWWFSTEKGIILGVNPIKGEPGRGAFAEWVFDLGHLPNNLAEVCLKIVTFRTHGGLHTEPGIAEKAIQEGQPKQGRLLIDGQMVDGIDLMKPMAHGLDYGFNRLDPYPITYWVKRCIEGRRPLMVRVQVDEGVAWDIDWIELRPFVFLPLDLNLLFRP